MCLWVIMEVIIKWNLSHPDYGQGRKSQEQKCTDLREKVGNQSIRNLKERSGNSLFCFEGSRNLSGEKAARARTRWMDVQQLAVLMTPMAFF